MVFSPPPVYWSYGNHHHLRNCGCCFGICIPRAVGKSQSHSYVYLYDVPFPFPIQTEVVEMRIDDAIMSYSAENPSADVNGLVDFVQNQVHDVV